VLLTTLPEGKGCKLLNVSLKPVVQRLIHVTDKHHSTLLDLVIAMMPWNM